MMGQFYEMIMSNLKNLNARAEQTFDAIKQRKGWVVKTLVEAAKKDSSDSEQFAG